MDILASELLLEIADYLNGDDLLVFLQLNTNTRRLKSCFQGVELTSFVTQQKDNRIIFNQNLKNLHFPLTDSVCTIGIQRRRCGVRLLGDRSVVSRLSLGTQSGYWNTDSPNQAVYFEVTVNKRKFNGLPMRIGLVHSNWDQTRPCGSLNGSVGYCSDGNISVGNVYDDQFLFGPVWKDGDVVGCGYTPFKNGSGLIFFTLNGYWVGDAPYRVAVDILQYRKRWHACFSSAGPCEIEFNLKGSDSPFIYQLEKYNVVPFFKQRESVDTKENFRLAANIVGKSLHSDLIDISDFGNVVTFSNIFQSGRSLQATIPFANSYDISKGYSYFEMTILNQYVGIGSFISFGLATRPYSALHHIGWDKESIGFHSDDGSIYHNSHSVGQKVSTGFGHESVVGCGYDPIKQTVFFTQGGVKVTSDILVEGVLYIALTATSSWRVKLNFGDEIFVYQGQ
ncbi:hypothetical protein BC833DRAFT_601522 [Globomyces pollinis-pini]|nr:hypothetical protein BC833DRAFT_601522 [Globomyces pollinis-pini]